MIVPDPHPARARCRSCDAPIIWARSAAGNNMPLDAEPTTNGNVELVPSREIGSFAGALVARVVSEPTLFETPLYMPHHATCPDAAEWRKR